MSKLGNSSVRYEIAIFHAGGEEAIAEGFFTHVYVDREDTASQTPAPRLAPRA